MSMLNKAEGLAFQADPVLEIPGTGIITAVWQWFQTGRQRQALSELDPHLLADIGLSSEDVRAELAKPFWR